MFPTAWDIYQFWGGHDDLNEYFPWTYGARLAGFHGFFLDVIMMPLAGTFFIFVK